MKSKQKEEGRTSSKLERQIFIIKSKRQEGSSPKEINTNKHPPNIVIMSILPTPPTKLRRQHIQNILLLPIDNLISNFSNLLCINKTSFMKSNFLPVKTRTSPHGIVFFPFTPKPYLTPQRLNLLTSCQSKPTTIVMNKIELNYPSINLVSDCVESDLEKVLDSGFKTVPSNLDVQVEKLPNVMKLNEKSERIIGRDVIRLDKGGGGGGYVRFNKERLKMYSGMLRECASKGSLNEAKAIHGQVMVKGISPDSHLWVSLVNVYSKCGSAKCARRVFDEMPEKDVVSWTTLISGFVAEGYGGDGVRLFHEMRENGVMPNEFTLATTLKACSMGFDLGFGKQVHVDVIKVGALSDVYVGSALVDLYSKSGAMDFAEKVFLSMPVQNGVSWNALLNGYAQTGNTIKLLKLFCRITEPDMKFGKFTLSTVLKGCANSGNMREGQSIHSIAIRIGCQLDAFMSCCLVDMYSKCGMAHDALKVFKEIKEPDIVTWSAMITCLHQQGENREAVKLFCHMVQTGIKPNQFTLASLVSSAFDFNDLNYGKSTHALTLKYGFASDNSVGNALVSMYMKYGDIEKGSLVFDSMIDRDLISWNSLLSGYHNNKTCNEGQNIFYQMLIEGLKPNKYTYISILRSCSCLLSVGFGKQVHAHIIKNSLNGDDYVGTALIDMYAKNKCLDDADIVFHRLIERDIFTWTVIIAGYAQADQPEKGIKYFSLMQREGVKPNEFTFASCLSCCAHLTTLENGKQFHSMALKSGYVDDLFVAGSLVDMYGKCGSIEAAETIFDGLVSRDTVLWNTMICGYTQHGQGKKALETFSIMINQGIIPDEVTFIGVLSACSHMGFTEEGKHYFNSLTNIYGIVPTIDHYSCMVDILGRAGKFDEVKTFIDEMKLTPTALIWETVLGACKLHGNLEFGKVAANKLFELKPEMDSSYVLLSNIFASKGMWEGVKDVRALMSNQGIKKEPGCSWVEIGSQIHLFSAQDSSHPKIKEIHKILEELNEKLIAVGYIAKTEHVLHNVSESEKRDSLLYHSERLALAFSLLSTNSRKTIRIYKNLRICGDCHDVMKLLSDITCREIIVRDIKHFHHFKNGNCSCHDYW